MSSCKKDISEADQKAIIEALFSAGMTWNAEQDTAKSKILKSSYPINYSVDEYVYGTEGGNIHVFGTITGNMIFNDVSNEVTGGTLLIGFSETINDYKFDSEGDIYTMNGDPYISLTGTFSLLAGGNSFGSASSMQIGGGIHLTGPQYDKTINLRITINVNSNGTGGKVSGTINDEPINYSF